MGVVIGRRSCGLEHEKLRELIKPDMFDYSAMTDQSRLRSRSVQHRVADVVDDQVDFFGGHLEVRGEAE